MCATATYYLADAAMCYSCSVQLNSAVVTYQTASCLLTARNCTETLWLVGKSQWYCRMLARLGQCQVAGGRTAHFVIDLPQQHEPSLAGKPE